MGSNVYNELLNTKSYARINVFLILKLETQQSTLTWETSKYERMRKDIWLAKHICLERTSSMK